MQRLQEEAFGADRDYRAGSPHLRHWQLYDALASLVREAVHGIRQAGLPATVLELGAGHGGYTEPTLAAGCAVTVTEMSRPSVERLRTRFDGNERLSVVFDERGDLAPIGDKRFSLILAVSVLHHVPDYLSFVLDAVEHHLEPGGTFLSVQDPLWYPSVPRATRVLERFAFLSWRLFQGNYRTGAATLLRRIRGVYDEEKPGDMVEYHAVRQGLDHAALHGVLSSRFEECSLHTYWSTQAPLWQAVGNLARMRNTFALRAIGYSPASVATTRRPDQSGDH